MCTVFKIASSPPRACTLAAQTVEHSLRYHDSYKPLTRNTAPNETTAKSKLHVGKNSIYQETELQLEKINEK